MSISTTRVVACTGGGGTRLERRPRPRPGAGELLLAVRAVGLCGTDLFKLATDAAAPGTVLGHELVGEVVEAGEAVDGLRRGDRIAVPHHVPCGECALCERGNETMCATFRENLLEPGGFSEQVLVRERARVHAAHRIPERVPDSAAVFMEPAACVVRAVERAGLPGRGGLAVVLGAGSMGLLHLLVLRAIAPQRPVVVLDPDGARAARAAELGAAHAGAPGLAARRAVDGLSAGLGADAVFDTVGGPGPLANALALGRPGATVVLFAHAPDGARADFDLNAMFRREQRVIGAYSGGPREQERVFEMLCAGSLDPTPLVTHVLPLERFGEGVALARERRALKVVFDPRIGARG